MNNPKQTLEVLSGIKAYFNEFPYEIPFFLNKSIPENFIVQEILPNNTILNESSTLGEPENGLFFHCILKKKLIDTPSAIKLISRQLRIPIDWVGYAGLKDAQGITSQRISIFNTSFDSIKTVSSSNFVLNNIVRKKYEITLGDLWGNHFILMLDLKENRLLDEKQLDNINESLTAVGQSKFPNFYGLQRFGSTRPVSHIIGKYLIKNNYEDAVKTYLTYTSDFESEKITSLRRKLAFDWDLTSFLENIPKHFQYEFLMAKSLKKFPNNYFRAFNEIPQRMKRFFINSYQSYLFNELLSFYIDESTYKEKPLQKIPLLTQNSDFSSLPDPLLQRLEILLANDQISKNDFQNIKIPFKSTKNQERNTFVTLKDFSFSLQRDKLFLEFSLPKSTYATMITREIEQRKNKN